MATPIGIGAWIKVLEPAPNAPGVKRWRHGIVSGVAGADIRVVYPRVMPADGSHHHVVVEAPLDDFIGGGADAQVVDVEPALGRSLVPADVAARARTFVGVHDYQLPMLVEHFASYLHLVAQ
jgi:hypothetical protein